MIRRGKKLLSVALLLCVFCFVSESYSHFQYLLPSDDIVTTGESTNIVLEVVFGHPFLGQFMNMERPLRFGVAVRGETVSLLDALKPLQIEKGITAYTATYRIRKPGDHVFYVEPFPYFEPAEEAFIIHYAKVVVHALGLEQGWDREIGLKTEIIPLTRPYGLWTGNVFQGIVKAFGKPVPYAEVEVEYYADGKMRAPAEPFVTQLVKADRNGVFTFACSKAGWWAFAALSKDKKPMKHSNGKTYPVEIGAVFWVKVHDMPDGE